MSEKTTTSTDSGTSEVGRKTSVIDTLTGGGVTYQDITVKVQTGATDSAGRPAVEISRVDTVTRETVQTFENPKTGATLESAWVQASGGLDEDLYLSTTYTSSIPANPYQG